MAAAGALLGVPTEALTAFAILLDLLEEGFLDIGDAWQSATIAPGRRSS
jgi:hypothetical protein